MKSKVYVTAFMLIGLVVSGSATTQVLTPLLYQGSNLWVRGNVLNREMTELYLSQKDEIDFFCSANWSGVWEKLEIRNNKLFLTYLSVYPYDENFGGKKKPELATEKMFGVTVPTNGIFASWFTGDVVEPLGERLLIMSHVTAKIRAFSFTNGILQSLIERDSDYMVKVKEQRVEDEQRAKAIRDFDAGELSAISWDDIAKFLVHDELSYDERNSTWEGYNGKKVRWEGIVDQIREVPHSAAHYSNPRIWIGEIPQPTNTFHFQIKMLPESEAAEVYLELRDTDNHKASKVKEGDRITFTGMLSSWGGGILVSLRRGTIVKMQDAQQRPASDDLKSKP